MNKSRENLIKTDVRVEIWTRIWNWEVYVILNYNLTSGDANVLLNKRDFRLPSACSGGLHSSDMLRGACWYRVADVSGQQICTIFQGSTGPATDKPSRNHLPTLRYIAEDRQYLPITHFLVHVFLLDTQNEFFCTAENCSRRTAILRQQIYRTFEIRDLSYLCKVFYIFLSLGGSLRTVSKRIC